MSSHPEPRLRAVLISTYELGRQPFGLASPAAWLRRRPVDVTCVDTAVQPLDRRAVRDADLVAFHVPMHTATRIAVALIETVRATNPDAHLCVYGLYAPVNEKLLRDIGVHTVLGGEFEEPLAALAERLRHAKAGGTSASRQPRQHLPVISMSRQRFEVPYRAGLPGLGSYASLVLPDGSRKTVGYTEATRGCKHVCRHCPVVPVYNGRFRVVQPDVVIDDISQQVAAGAGHITFGDPDFLNAPAHALAVVAELHRRHPDITFDATIKVEHLVKQAQHLPALREAGCILVTTAVESFDDRILDIFDKHHTREDLATTLNLLRPLGIALNPTFVGFTPWTTMRVYVDMLETICELGLVPNVAPIQYALRLLIPEGSRLLDLPETHQFLQGFDQPALSYRWAHPDQRMDRLQQTIYRLVADTDGADVTRAEVFRRVCAATADHTLTHAEAGLREWLTRLRPDPHDTTTVPALTEAWYCCAEPTEAQLRQPGLTTPI